jgi:hypothetical protein
MAKPPELSCRVNTLLFISMLLGLSLIVRAQSSLKRISVDTLTNTDSKHKSEVEPHSFAWGNTIVSGFQVARRPGTVGWGSGDIGFSTSKDGGVSWHYGLLPGLTVNYGSGTYGAITDASVAYDAKHGQWLISTLPLVALKCCSKFGDVAVSRSTDGIHWENPILIDKSHLDDKNWTVCDNTPSSQFYGNCYTEWDQAFGSGEVLMSVSSDGGLIWGPGKASANHAHGLAGEPVVQPNGTVIVPFEAGGIGVFSSTNGGQSWGASKVIASINTHLVAGGIRNHDFLSAAIDETGKVYVVWSDCRFRTGCEQNDIVMSTSTDGSTWSAVRRIPIDPTTSTVDHFIPGIGVNPQTSGGNTHIAIVYYYYPIASCTISTCQLDVGFTTSTDGGATWTAGSPLAGPMKLSWLPNSNQGWMVGDYIVVSYDNGNPFGVFAVAQAPTKGGVLHESMYTTNNPLPISYSAPRFSSSGEQPVPGFKSDHKMQFFYDDEGTRPIPRSRWLRNPQ